MERTQEIKKEIQKLVDELYQHDLSERLVQPVYPWMLVWILPKATVREGIILPERQNKIMHEGIVCATWHPFWTPKVRESDSSGYSYSICKTSQFQIGDHIIFPHWAGQPGGFLDNKEYRFIKEDSNYNPPDIPPAKFNYDQLSIVEQLANNLPGMVPGCTAREMAEGLLKKYYIAPRLGQQPRTLSGS